MAQYRLQYPWTSAGPTDRAGFIDAPVTSGLDVKSNSQANANPPIFPARLQAQLVMDVNLAAKGMSARSQQNKRRDRRFFA